MMVRARHGLLLVMALLCVGSLVALSSGGLTRREKLQAASASLAALSVSATPAMAAAPLEFTKTESGLQIADVKVGTGIEPTAGQTVKVQYTGWLNDFDDLEGKFDSSYERGRPLTFAVGTGRVIKGWDEALLTMKVGGVRRIIIPPELGYGK